ncbi:MAG: VOC family protein [Bryobacteraceae bacterium]
MKIIVTSVLVDDQAKALAFYTDVLGFVKKTDIPLGADRWLTVSDGAGDVELLLEPNRHPASNAFQKALFADGIPLAMFGVEDIQKEFKRLSALGVKFHTNPVKRGPVTIAVLEDTCGNLVQIVQQ